MRLPMSEKSCRRLWQHLSKKASVALIRNYKDLLTQMHSYLAWKAEHLLRSEFGDPSTMEGSVKGLYPCGEGAGYAGGITSAAMDGIRMAEAVAGELR